MTVKDELVDQLDEEAAREALALLQDLRLARVLREAPIDDEPETEKEQTAVAEARERFPRGHVVRDEDLARELG